MSGFELPIRAMRQQISSALDLVVHTARMTDGTRKVVGISEVAGMEGDMIMIQELFAFQREGADDDGRIRGRFVSTGIRPRFADRVKSSSHSVDLNIFDYLES
jgi:pilus assembly protein CpaF